MQGKKVVNYFQTKQTKIHKNDHNIKKKNYNKKDPKQKLPKHIFIKTRKTLFFSKM